MEKQSIRILREWISGSLKPSRWQHTLRCQECAVKLAKHYDFNWEKAAVAALCHDSFRDLSASQWLRLAEMWELPIEVEERQAPVLLHGPLAAIYLEDHGFCRDQDILSAIRYHTSGHRELGPIGKIVFLADGIEPGRIFPERESIEKIAYQNLDQACFQMLKSNISYLEKHGLVCHPASYQWLAELIKQRKSGV